MGTLTLAGNSYTSMNETIALILILGALMLFAYDCLTDLDE